MLRTLLPLPQATYTKFHLATILTSRPFRITTPAISNEAHSGAWHRAESVKYGTLQLPDRLWIRQTEATVS